MAEKNELWHKYFRDFAYEKLRVGGKASDMVVTLLRSWHQQKGDQSPNMDAKKIIIANLVSLHISVQHLSKVISILRPIADLETLVKEYISKGKTTLSHLETEGSIFERPEDICLYVVNSLFQPLTQTLIGQTSVEALNEVVASWNAVYQKIVSSHNQSCIQPSTCKICIFLNTAIHTTIQKVDI